MKKNSKKGKARKGKFMVSEFLEYEPLDYEQYYQYLGEAPPFNDLKKAVSAARKLADKSPHGQDPNYTILIHTPDNVFLVGDDWYVFEKGLLFVLYKGKLIKKKNTKKILMSLPVHFAEQNGVFVADDRSYFKLLQLKDGQWTIEVFSISGTKMGNHGRFSKKEDAIEMIEYLCGADLDIDNFIRLPIRFEHKWPGINDDLEDEDDTMALGHYLAEAAAYLNPLGYEISVNFSATPKKTGPRMPMFKGDDLLKVIKGVEKYFEKIWSSKNRHPVKRLLPK